MVSLTALSWIMTSKTIVTAVVLLMFVFSILFRLIRG